MFFEGTALDTEITHCFLAVETTLIHHSAPLRIGDPGPMPH